MSLALGCRDAPWWLQLAVEAEEAKEKANAQVFEVVSMIEENTRMQQQYAAFAASLQEQLNVASTDVQVRARFLAWRGRVEHALPQP